MRNMKRLQDKVAVITGGNSGIGKGIAQHFLREGAKVVILGRNQATLEQAKAEWGANVLAIQGDITDVNDLTNLYKTTLAHFGKIDVLVVNSGVTERLGIEEVTEEKFDNIVNTNYRGAFFTVKYAIDCLNSFASIILIASGAAHISIKRHSIYSTTKAAMVKLAKNLAFELSDKMIRVNSISPGFVETPIFSKRLQSNPDYLKERIPFIPLQRIGTTQDIANAALFLASDESSYITGVDLLVDGGITASFPVENI